MAQASVNLAKKQGLALSERESSASAASSEQEDIDFKSLDDELYDQEISHILTKENGDTKVSRSDSDSLNTPEIDYEGPCGDMRVQSDSQAEDRSEGNVQDNIEDSCSSVSGASSSTKSNKADTIKKDNATEDEDENNEDESNEDSSSSSSDSNDDDNDNSQDETIRSEGERPNELEDISEEEEDGTKDGKSNDFEDVSESEAESDCDKTEERDKEDNIKANHKLGQKHGTLNGHLASKSAGESMYDPISEDSNGACDDEETAPPSSSKFEPVSDDEKDSVDKTKTTDASKDILEVEKGEKKSGERTTENVEKGEESSEKEDAEGISGLIVSEVYSLKEADEKTEDAIQHADESQSHGEEQDKERNLEKEENQGVNSSASTEEMNENGNVSVEKKAKSKRKTKQSERNFVEDDYFTLGTKIKEEPLDDGYEGQEEHYSDKRLDSGQFEYLNEYPEADSAAAKDKNCEVFHDFEGVVYRCKLCSCRFREYHRYEEHRRKNHMKLYSCKHCGEKFERSQILAIHVRVNHVIDSFKKKDKDEGAKGGNIRKFSIAEKKKKHSSGLYGSQIVNIGNEETEVDLNDESYSPVEKKSKKKSVKKHAYINSLGRVVKKAKRRSKSSSSVMVNGVLMYKCNYCEQLFVKQQKMACHVRNFHILEKDNQNCLVYPRREEKKRRESLLENIDSNELVYGINEEGDLEIKKTREEDEDEELQAMYIDTTQMRKLSNEMKTGEKRKRSESPPKSNKRVTRISASSDHQDEDLAELQEKYNIQIDSKIFTCEHCDKWFFRKSDFDQHMQKHSRDSILNAADDGELENKLDGSKLEELEDEFKPVSFCKYCPSKFESANKLKIHIVRHLGEVEVSDDTDRAKFTCRVCSEGKNDSKAMRLHLKTHFPEIIENMDPHSLADCKFCGLPFLTSDRLQQHEKTHSDFLEGKRLRKTQKQEKLKEQTTTDKQSAKNPTVTEGKDKSVETKLPTASDLGEQVQKLLESAIDQVDAKDKGKTDIPQPYIDKCMFKDEKSIPKVSKSDTETKSKETKLEEDFIRKAFKDIPFECGMCKSRFPSSHYLLHHMTLHMKGKYVFRVDQETEVQKLESEVKSTTFPNPSQTVTKPLSEVPKAPPKPATTIPQLPQIAVPTNLVRSQPISLLKKPFIQKPQQPVVQLPAKPTNALPTSNPTRATLASSILVRKVVPQDISNCVIIPKLSTPQQFVPQGNFVRLPYSGSGPIFLSQTGQPIMMANANSSSQGTQAVSLLTTPKPTQTALPNQVVFAPVNAQGIASSTTGGKPLISLINPHAVQSYAKVQAKPKPSASNTAPTAVSSVPSPKVIRVSATNPDQGFPKTSMLRSLINKNPSKTVEKDRDDLPNIDSDEDLMNCSSPDSVMGMDSDSESENITKTADKLKEKAVSIQTEKGSSEMKTEIQKKETEERSSIEQTESKQSVKKAKKKFCSGSSQPKTGRAMKSAKSIPFAKGQWYECSLCMFRFEKIEEYQKHVRSHSGTKKDRKHTCTVCGRQFLTKFHIEKHRALHRMNEYECSVCNLSFSSSGDVVQHMAEAHP